MSTLRRLYNKLIARLPVWCPPRRLARIRLRDGSVVYITRNEKTYAIEYDHYDYVDDLPDDINKKLWDI